MSRGTKYTAEEKHKILTAYENGIGSMKEIATKYEISVDTFCKWRYNNSKYGIAGLKESKTWKRYSKELKEAAVKDYTSGRFSQNEVAKKYEISNKSLLQNWLKKYNDHRELKAMTKGMSQSMIKGRVTSWKERIEITLYCIAQATIINTLLRFIMSPTSKYINGLKNMNLVKKVHLRIEEEEKNLKRN
nr:transposase [Clostridium algoriphilum]